MYFSKFEAKATSSFEIITKILVGWTNLPLSRCKTGLKSHYAECKTFLPPSVFQVESHKSQTKCKDKKKAANI